MANANLSKAKNAKNDEFYTQWNDIEKEVNAYLEFNPDVFKGKTILLPCDDPEWSNFTKFFAQNFEKLGLKKLISTSYAPESKNFKTIYEPTLFEAQSPHFCADKTKIKGKIFTLTRDINESGKIDIDDLEWDYLQGNGDFRSNEVKALRDEADIIMTNPPFSLFREFVAWIVEGGKQFIIIGIMNGLKYKEIFPLIQNNTIWMGRGFNLSLVFKTPYKNLLKANRKFVEQKGFNPDENYIKTPAVCWYTNIDHGRRHQPLQLMTMADNMKYSRHKEIKGKKYQEYNNYDAIDVPFTDAIPSDYEGKMGVPISFLDKYCPEQFEIIGNASDTDSLRQIGVKIMGQVAIDNLRKQGNKAHVTANMNSLYTITNGKVTLPYARIIIRKKQ